MKKTLNIIGVMVGCVSSAFALTGTPGDNDNPASLSITSPEGFKAGGTLGGTAASDITATQVADDYVFSLSSDNRFDVVAGESRSVVTFSLVFDTYCLKEWLKTNTSATIVSTGDLVDKNSNTHHWGMALDSGKLYGTWDGAYSGDNTTIADKTLAELLASVTSPSLTISVTTGDGAASNGGTCIYVEGVGAVYTDTGLKFGNAVTSIAVSKALVDSNILIGMSVYGNDIASGTNLETYNTFAQAVRKDVVPEPATATLSLLALAGLAARRRRK